MQSLYENYIEETPQNIPDVPQVTNSSLFANYQENIEDKKIPLNTKKVNVVKSQQVLPNTNNLPQPVSYNNFAPKPLPNAGFIPMAQRMGTGLYEGIKGLPHALVDFGHQLVDTGKQEFSQGYNPFYAYGALGLGAMQGAGNLVDGVWNLPADLYNTYYGYEKVKPTYPLTQGIPSLIDKTEIGHNYLNNAQALMDRYPFTTMLSQELGEEVPAMLVGATTAKYGMKAGKLAKTADKISEVGYKKLIGHSAVSGFGEGFIVDPAQNQAFNMTPEERIKNRFTNAGSGAVIAPTLNVGGKAIIDNAPKAYNKIKAITPKAVNAVKEVNAKIINYGNETFNAPTAFDDLKSIRKETSNSLYKNYNKPHNNPTEKVVVTEMQQPKVDEKIKQNKNNSDVDIVREANFTKSELITKAKDLGIKGNLNKMKIDTLKSNIEKAETSVNLNKHIWEGWTVQEFIKELEPSFDKVMQGNAITKPLKNRLEVKNFCMNNQPYYKKYIPDVVNYFTKKYNLPNDIVNTKANVIETSLKKLNNNDVTVQKTNLPDLFSKDKNAKVYKVSESDKTSSIINKDDLIKKSKNYDKINKKTDNNAQPIFSKPEVPTKNVVNAKFNKSKGETNGRPVQATNGKRHRISNEKIAKPERNGEISERKPRTSKPVHKIGRGNELHNNGRRLRAEHEELVNTKFKKQHELNEAIKSFIKNNEHEKYNGELPDEIKNWLKKYSGAGGLEKQGATGRGLLSEYYTPEHIVKEMWELTQKHKNLNNANVLEPSAGIGRFFEYAPDNVKLNAVEMDNISGKIAKLLYPNANIKIEPFQERFIDRKKNLPIKNVSPEYDVIIGNPPYGKYTGEYKGLGEEKSISKLETYFIKRGLDLLKDDGILSLIVPSSFLDTPNNITKMNISKMATIVDAYRLPEKTFSTTNIGTDIIILKKTKNLNDKNLFNNGEWFKQYPDKIRGEVYTKKNQFGKTVTAVKRHKNTAKDLKTETPVKKDYETFKPDDSIDDYKLFADTRVDGTLAPDKYSVGEKVNQYQNNLYNDFNYLQGDIYEKLDALENENISKEQKAIQRKKLLNVLPKPKELEQIYLTPTSQFIKEISLGEIEKEKYNYYTQKNEIEIVQDTLDKRFLNYLSEISSSERNSIRLDYLTKYVNGEDLRIDTFGEKEQKAQQRIELLTKIKNTADKLFNDFVATKISEDEKKLLKDKWNRSYNALYNPDYKKMPLLVKDLSKTFYGKPLNLLSTQIEGINFITNKGVGLVGFEVGVGKTLTGAIATVQQLQMGRCKRPLVIVPKQVKNNWIREFNQAFPNYKVNDLDNLSKLKGKIEEGTISIATFEALNNIWYDEKIIKNDDGSITRTGEIKDLINKLYDIAKDSKREETLRGAEKQKEDIEKIIGIAEKGNLKRFTVNGLGIDHVTIDEAHNFRNLFRSAKAYGRDNNAYNSIGQSGDPSARAARLFLLVQHLLNKNNNRNVFMLTATPFNNSPLEVFNMLSFLAKDRLDKMGLYNVYQFMENYASIDTEWVVKNNNDVKFAQVVKAFKNVGSLKELIKSFMIIRSADEAGVVRPNKHVDKVILEPSQKQLDLIEEFEHEAVSSKDDGAILKQINMARQATLSPDIASKNFSVSSRDFIKNSPKLEYVVKAVAEMQKKDPTTSQLIYMPLGKEFLPKIKEYFIENNIYKPDEVEIISSDTPDKKIPKITDEFNKKDGRVKLIIGTQKIKEGMNLNKNTSVLYIPFIDWNPTDFVQICGRIWRQGNSYNDVKIVVPLLKNSSDPFMFQKLDEKTSRINNILADNEGKEFIETGELNTAEEKLAMITLPDKKAEMAVKFENQKLENERTKINGRIETVKYYQNKLNNLISEIKSIKSDTIPQISYDKNTKGHLYGDDYFDNKLQSAEKDLYKKEKELSSLKTRIERLELDFNGKDNIENLKKELADIDVKEKELSEFKKIKLQEYTQKYEEELKNKVTIDEHIENFKKSINELYGSNSSNEEFSISINDTSLKDYEKTAKNDFRNPRKKLTTLSQEKTKKKAKAKIEKLKRIKNIEIHNKNIKHAISKWNAEIEKRRYDINKTLNAFGNDLKPIAKRLKTNEKALRELMPFLRERTEFPDELNRPDLKKLWDKLTPSDKKILTNKADKLSNYFEKYWNEYKAVNNYSDDTINVDNYITHIWDLDNKKKSLLTNYFNTNSKFAKERKLKTLFDGIKGIELDNGEIVKFTPKTLDYSEILKIQSDNLIKATFNKLLAEQVKNLKTSDGLNLVLPAHKAPANWITINHPALNKTIAKPVGSDFGETVSPKLQNILVDMGVAIGRRLNPPKAGKTTYFEGKYIHNKPPEIRLQRWFSNKTLAHEIGHAIDKILNLKDNGFAQKYKKELYALNEERINKLSKKGKKHYATKDSELIAELAGFVFNDTLRAYDKAPHATVEFIDLITKNDNLKKLLPQNFDWKNAKHVLEERKIELIRTSVKVHPEIADTLKLVFQDLGEASAYGKVYDNINAVLKQFQLGFSGFHGFALTESALANLGIVKTAKILNPVKVFHSLLNNQWDIYKQDDIVKKGIDYGLQLEAPLDIHRSLVEHLLDDTSKFIEQKTPIIGKQISTPFKALSKAQKINNLILWTHLHNMFKIETFKTAVLEEAQKGKLTDDKYREIAQWCNDSYGGQVWENLEIKPKGKKWSQRILRSPDWLISTTRQFLGVLSSERTQKFLNKVPENSVFWQKAKNLARQWGIGSITDDVTSAGMRGKIARKFWLRAFIQSVIYMNVLNAIFREKDRKENPDLYPQKMTGRDYSMMGNSRGDKTYVFIGRNNDGTERYWRLGKQFREVPEMVLKPTEKLGGKASPILDLASQTFTGKSLSNFENRDLSNKKGLSRIPAVGKMYVNSILPFSFNSLVNQSKDFSPLDFFAQTSKGTTFYKGKEQYLEALKHKDKKVIKEISKDLKRNKINASDTFSSAVKDYRKQQRSELFKQILKNKK